MKKSILTTLVAACTSASAHAQGTVIFENSFSTGAITTGVSGNPYAGAGTYTVALLWAPGNIPGVAQNAFTVIGTFGPAGTQAGFFFDPNVLTTGAATVPGTVGVFEVQGWLGNYSSYAAAVASGEPYFGQSPEFLNSTGNPNLPGFPPVQTTGWDGNLLIFTWPEPSTVAIAGLGASVWLYFRRRK